MNKAKYTTRNLRPLMRHLRKLFNRYMGEAAHANEMNHAFDAGEFSGAYDGQTYKAYVAKFKEDLKAMGVSWLGFSAMLYKFSKQDKHQHGGWYDMYCTIRQTENIQ